MKSYASIKLGSLGSFSIQHSISADADRPPGVAADAWIRLEENLGIVFAPPQASAGSTAASSSATGYMMIKYHGSWLRLNLETQPASSSP